MSLLLDALKEAEAQKRQAAPIRAPTSGASFETDGALALAEYVAAEPVEASPVLAPRAMATLSVATATSTSTGTVTPSAPTPADLLLAARAARAAPSAPTPAVSRAPPVVAPAAAAAMKEAAHAKPAGRRPGMPWLIGFGVALAMLVGALFVFDRWSNQPTAPFVPPAGAITAAPTAVTSAADEPVPAAAANSTSFLTMDPVTSMPRSAPTAAARSRESDAPLASPRPRPRPVPTAAEPASEQVRISISREAAPLEAAFAALQAGDLDRAESLYRQVLAAEPGQADAQLALAVISQSRGDDAAALRGFRRVLESVPDQPRAWAGLAELAGEGEAGTIESRLRQLLAARSSAPLHFALGNLLARQQRWDDAQVEYFAAAALAPQAPDYAFNVAVALERIGQPRAALPWYNRSLELVDRGRAARFETAAVRARVQSLQAAPP